MSKEQFLLVQHEVLEMLEKGAIQKVIPTQGKFLSNLFLIEKKDRGNRPVKNLKNVNKFIPYEHFKMEGLHCMKFLLEQDDLLGKTDLREKYFSVPLNKNSQKFARFQCSGNLYEFLCLCFGLRLAPRIFTKLLKVPIAVLRRANIRIIAYLNDMLLMGRMLPKMFMARDTLTFLLQHFGFAINFKKSVRHPVKQNKFLGLVMDTEKMTLSSFGEKNLNMCLTCLNVRRF